MKKAIIIFVLFLNFFILSCGQGSYRIKPFADKGDFIYPPFSRLKSSCKIVDGEKIYTLKKSCRFQYVSYVDSMKTNHGDYYTFLNSLNLMEHFSSKDSIENICFQKKYFGCYNNTEDTIDRFCKIKYNKKRRAFLLQIDYEEIFTGNSKDEIQKLNTKYGTKKAELDSILRSIDTAETEKVKNINKTISELTKTYEYSISEPGIIEARFFEIAKDLIIEFNNREGTGEGEFGWPTSISQDVVEKIFEVIPIPNQSSLSRYISQIDNEKSFILLNPKINLKVDAVEILTNETTQDWQYRLLNSNLITISKDSNGNIVQLPFLQFEKLAANALPDNKFVEVTENGKKIKKILQASSGDIQLSSTLNKCPFIFLQQENFKKNNINSSDGTCAGYELDMFKCNSLLLHFDDLSSFYNTGNKLIDESKAKYLSSFGFRNLITPQINIFLNSNYLGIPLNTTFNQLKHQRNLPDSFSILRLWKGKYVKVKFKNISEIILLPADIIKY